MKVASPPPEVLATRDQLLEAAAEIFAEKGFRATTVREICQRAGANVAAVNYHFRDKAGLYAEVLRYTWRCAQAVYPLYGTPNAENDPATQLRDFVRSYLLRIFDPGHHSLHGRLISREMFEPTAALDTLVEEEFRPLASHVTVIMRSLLGPAAEDETLRFCGMSVVGQCLFYHHARPVLGKVFPGMQFGPEEIRKLTEHITHFCLAGIRSFAKGQANAGRKRR